MMKKIVIQLSVLFLSTYTFAQSPSKMENLGPLVNSKYAEVRPTISADGKQLYFAVEGHPQNAKIAVTKEAQDVWFSELGSDGKWGQAKPVLFPINTRIANSVFWVAPDGNRILIRGAYENGAYIGRGISMCYKTADNWSKPVKLNIKEYDRMSLGVYSGAMLANDGKTLLLYFSEEKDALDNDIYVSFLIGENEWSQPKSLGPVINSEFSDEFAPFLASDGVTLYFSSDRDGGLGKKDIWMTRRMDDSWNSWSKPVNLGAPINTADWDAYFTLDANGQDAYMVSSKNSIGSTDIVKIKMNDKALPNAVALVYGRVFDAKTKQPISVAFYYDSLPGGNNAGNSFSSPVDGSYKMVLPYGTKYKLRATSDKFFPMEDTIDLAIPGSYKEIHRDLYLSDIKDLPVSMNDGNNKDLANNDQKDKADNNNQVSDDGTTGEEDIRTINNITYDFGKPILRSPSFAQLDRVVRALKQQPTAIVEISAHTDNVGSVQANIVLSNDRANAVRQYLISKGIKESRMSIKGYGESKPIASNKTDEGRQLNRRVEFKITKK